MSSQIPLKIDSKNILLQNYQSLKRNADQKLPGIHSTKCYSNWTLAKLSGGAKLKKIFSVTRKKCTPNTMMINTVTSLLKTTLKFLQNSGKIGLRNKNTKKLKMCSGKYGLTRVSLQNVFR